MKKIAIVMFLFVGSAQAGIEPMVVRSGADRYVLGDGTSVLTRGCTVSAGRSDTLSARLDLDSPRPWLWFYDRDGFEEGSCEVLAVVRGGRHAL